MTIAELCRRGTTILQRASTSPALDAELLLASLLKKPREYVLAHGGDDVPDRISTKYWHLLERRQAGIPIPYLTRTKEFYGRAFVVTPAVMVPRPETEALAAAAIGLLREMRNEKRGMRTVVDVGTGSGVLAVTIATEVPTTRVIAVDRSGASLEVARRNARRQRVLGRTMFLESDLLKEIPSEYHPHLIVANLPYVTSDHLKHAGEHPDTRGLTFEPFRALDGGPDGLYVFRRFFAQLTRLSHMTRSLRGLLLEHSPSQRRKILELAHDTLPGFTPVEPHPFVTSWTRGPE